jgi:HEPN domain-containing protein
MPPDAEKVQLTHEWLVIAASDLRAAQLLKQASPPLVDQALYQCQQCADKTLKAFLAWHETPFRRTHNLDELGSQCVASDPTLEHVIREAGMLRAYGWMYRYPGSSEIEPDPTDADEAYRCASDTLRAFLSRLPAEVAP